MNPGDNQQEGSTREEDEDVLETWAPETLSVKKLCLSRYHVDWPLVILVSGWALFLAGICLAPIWDHSCYRSYSIAWYLYECEWVPLFLLFVLVAPWLMWRSLRLRAPIFVWNTSYRLTRSSVQIRVGSVLREHSLSDLDGIGILLVRGHQGIGHVVFRDQRSQRRSPAIPVHRPRAGRFLGVWRRGRSWNADCQVYDAVPPHDLHKQLHDGAMTLWLVANPERVRERILQVASGFNPNARGPYR